MSCVNGESPIVCVDRKKADILASALTSCEGVQHKVVDAILVGKVAEEKKPNRIIQAPPHEHVIEHATEEYLEVLEPYKERIIEAFKDAFAKGLFASFTMQ